ncbi:MAG: hypothetical protein AAF990_15150 [Bacteroidota bacterium]
MKNWMLLWVLFGLFVQSACTSDTTGSSQQQAQQQADTTSAPKPSAEKRQIVAGKNVGPIEASFSEADIIQAVGADNVVRKEYGIGEGETAPASIVFPDSPKELVVFWKPDQLYQSIDYIRIEQPEASWRTSQDIGIGTTLEQLIILNGKEFNFYGFDWDYAGLAKDWNGGFIHKKLEVFLVAENPEAVYPHLLGDKLYSSSNLKARAADLVVDVMVIRF